MNAPENTPSRPWTIPALIALSVAGLVWNLISQDAGPSTWILGVGFPLAVVVAFGAWGAKRWAFTVMLASTLFLIIVVLPASYFLESNPPNLGVASLSLLGQLILLLHPATRGYATQHLAVGHAPRPGVRSPGDLSGDAEPVGVRRNTIVALIFLLTAIAIAGTLGVIRIYQMSGG